MVRKNEYISTHPDLHTGMTAYSLDGEKLGTIEHLDEDSITIEKGWFFPRDFTIPYDDIADVREDEIIVRESRSDLEDWRNERYAGWDEHNRGKRAPVEEGREAKAGEASREEETTIPVGQEEIEVTKRPVVKEEVPARKQRRTETRGVNEGLHKEDVEIEDEHPDRRK